MGEERLRQTVRLRIDTTKGMVCLHRGDTPALNCTLLDLSEMGCRCLVQLSGVELASAAKWKSILVPGESCEAEIRFDPHLHYLRVAVELRTLSTTPDGALHVGMLFRNLRDDERATLATAMLSVATEKIRLSRSVLKRATTAISERSSSGGTVQSSSAVAEPPPPPPANIDELMKQLQEPGAPTAAHPSKSGALAIRVTPRRKYPRYPISFPVQYQFCTDAGLPLSDAVFKGRVIDMSEGGIRMEGPLLSGVSEQELLQGTICVKARIHVPEEINGLCIARTSKITKQASSEAPAQGVLGLQIMELSDEHRRVLTQTLMRVTRGGTQGPLPEE